MARDAKTSLALPKIDTEEKSIDVRLRLKGKSACRPDGVPGGLCRGERVHRP